MAADSDEIRVAALGVLKRVGQDWEEAVVPVLPDYSGQGSHGFVVPRQPLLDLIHWWGRFLVGHCPREEFYLRAPLLLGCDLGLDPLALLLGRPTEHFADVSGPDRGPVSTPAAIRSLDQHM